ncbi:NACHT, LRR and PYD domains-containing protein 1b allele 3 isoform X2 [Thalassophryne amazonica]|uniref:NACHT, LRR and PYD domains-containing protein 1b allele 3 isoform X2 n=1 Tax=Thalassophryne amazonica TaxID=390379 RepID=UPI0014712565|nr:NACHT, LRR and PYD domains-containing protein 1b allele 3 isoform X2 [Thalassophryne amazonica]
MVAKMASCGAARHLEEGNCDVPVLEDKVCVNNNLAESDSSSSENTEPSTDESSEEDEDNNEDSDGCGEKDEGGETEANNKNSVDESNPGPDAEVLNGKDGAFFKVCCEKCKAIRQSQGHELVTPRRMSRGQLQVLLEGEGTYECSVTGLVFEVSERVHVRYSVLSWSKFANLLPDSWKSAGPIFNVDMINKEAAVLSLFSSSLPVPTRPENEMIFGVLHIKGIVHSVEPTVDHSNSHVTWRVTSLSPVGPIVQSSQSVEHHGVVLVYRQLGSNSNNYSFHIYLATNSSSDIKDIGKQVRSYKNRYIKIEKPPTCKLEECTYRLLSDPEGEIKPENLKFTLAVTKMKGYFEAFFEHPPPFKLSLIEMDSEQTVWSATIREGDCADNAEQKPKKRTIRQQTSSSPSEEELPVKNPDGRMNQME